MLAVVVGFLVGLLPPMVPTPPTAQPGRPSIVVRADRGEYRLEAYDASSGQLRWWRTLTGLQKSGSSESILLVKDEYGIIAVCPCGELIAFTHDGAGRWRTVLPQPPKGRPQQTVAALIIPVARAEQAGVIICKQTGALLPRLPNNESREGR